MKARRVWRLACALDELLARPRCTGRAMETLIGHVTRVLMARRECLSLLHVVYAFSRAAGDDAMSLQPGAIRELRQVRSLLPMMRSSLRRTWSPCVMASDASPYGLGAFQARISEDVVGGVGRVSERWRFAVEEAVRARAHTPEVHGGGWGPSSQEEGLRPTAEEDPQFEGPARVISRAARLGDAAVFGEVPPSLIRGAWKTVHAARVRHPDNILRPEAAGAVWSIRHVARSSAGFGRRVLLLVDNPALALAFTKGRARSRHLRRPLQQVCAWSLGSGSRFVVRWIPSEVNPADGPSRGSVGFWYHQLPAAAQPSAATWAEVVRQCEARLRRHDGGGVVSAPPSGNEAPAPCGDHPAALGQTRPSRCATAAKPRPGSAGGLGNAGRTATDGGAVPRAHHDAHRHPPAPPGLEPRRGARPHPDGALPGDVLRGGERGRGGQVAGVAGALLAPLLEEGRRPLAEGCACAEGMDGPRAHPAAAPASSSPDARHRRRSLLVRHLVAPPSSTPGSAWGLS